MTANKDSCKNDEFMAENMSLKGRRLYKVAGTFARADFSRVTRKLHYFSSAAFAYTVESVCIYEIMPEYY